MRSGVGTDAGTSHASRPVSVLAAALLVFVLAMITAPLVPLLDPDEGYYPATAAESVDAGRFWDLRFNGEPRWDKPVLTYALIDASFAVFGRSVTAARLPSALQGALIVLLVGSVTARMAGRRAGASTAWVLASTLGLGVFARAAHPELAVVLAITAAELCLALYLVESRTRPRIGLAIAAGTAIGCGTLAKGPVAMALPVLTMLTCLPVLRDRLPGLGPASRDASLAVLAAAVIAVPWYAAMTARYGTVFLREAIWRHNVERYASHSFGHTAGLLYFLVPLAAMLLPWTALLPAAVVSALRGPRDERGVLGRVLTIGGLVAFGFYSLSASKLPHYALAFVPPFAVSIGLWLADFEQATATRRAVTLTAWLSGAAGLVLAAVPWLVGTVVRTRDVLGGSPMSGAGLRRMLLIAAWPPSLVLLGLAAVLLAWRRTPARNLGALAAAGTVLPVVLIVSAGPLLRGTYPWERLGRRIPRDGGAVWEVGPRAPSLTFFAGRPVRRVTEAELERALEPDRDAWIVVDTRWLHQEAASRLPGRHIDVIDDHATMALAHVRPAGSLASRRKH